MTPSEDADWVEAPSTKRRQPSSISYCRTCLCWQALPEKAQQAGKPKKGSCHLNPPTVLPHQDPEMVKIQRPIVWEGDHCLQHIPAPHGTRELTFDASQN